MRTLIFVLGYWGLYIWAASTNIYLNSSFFEVVKFPKIGFIIIFVIMDYFELIKNSYRR